jgi:two-component system response regulator WspF
LKIALLDVDAQSRRAVERALGPTGHELTWTASSGAEALKKLAQSPPDLLLLSVSLGDISAAQVTRSAVTQGACAVLLLSDVEGRRGSEVYEAMGSGAVDVVLAPSLGANGKLRGEEAFWGKLRTVSRLLGQSCAKLPAQRAPEPSRALKLVALGASTGGPQALLSILSRLPKDLPAAIVIVQHVDTEFSGGMASWLADESGLRVEVARSGAVPTAGIVLLAGTADHLVMTSSGCFRYSVEPAALAYRPSVDVLFSSLADYWPERGAAVLLTGMGRDGAQGLLRLRQLGWHTLAQDEASSVVYGMPKAAAELKAATKVMAPSAIAAELSSYVTRGC